MKKVIYIFIIGLGLIATSCQKQDITPTSKAVMELPEWTNDASEGARLGDGETEDDKGGIVDEDEDDTGFDITDPNKPSEGSGGRGGQNNN